MAPSPTLVIHGGAGLVRARCFSAADEATFEACLRAALSAGLATLAAGGRALDAVQAAVVSMEDAEPFNAGRGAVYMADGHIEMDAAIMDGATSQAGAVAGVRTLRNPVVGARAILDDGQHVMLIGEGAERFCAGAGASTAEPAWFHTDLRWQQLQEARASHRVTLDHDALPEAGEVDKYGTVGAVALDEHGHVAAATSTGGMTNKRAGRVGDAPLIGAGTYANHTLAISCTGHGEHFMRAVAAHAVAQRVALLGESLNAASTYVLDEMAARGGRGGLIAVQVDGEVAMPFNTAGMFRGLGRLGAGRAGEVVSVDIW